MGKKLEGGQGRKGGRAGAGRDLQTPLPSSRALYGHLETEGCWYFHSLKAECLEDRVSSFQAALTKMPLTKSIATNSEMCVPLKPELNYFKDRKQGKKSHICIRTTTVDLFSDSEKRLCDGRRTSSDLK